MSFQPVNPKPYLNSLIGLKVCVRLKFSGTEYHGTLVSVDNYMNVLLDKDVCENLTKGTPLNNQVFVRCNNVMWIGKDV
ncbi:Small nuclear ribonucleoprotein F [Pichia kudriavzevii]|uniref:Small nuclear ribonucleoprotein F n=1 Tax=Pichia kudriavzevii TaxID=4909 RepID=A0A1V2LGF7_PICKU|nr:Small nuclear ribonucleoprotein F [Pichia kudriavzevii]